MLLKVLSWFIRSTSAASEKINENARAAKPWVVGHTSRSNILVTEG